MLSVDDTKNIRTRSEFIDFLQKLYNDFKMNKSNWENSDLDTFLEALIAYTEDVDGFYKNQKISIDLENPNWRLFAEILAGASIYE